LFEIPLLYYKYGEIMAKFGYNFNNIAYFIIAYAIFAFLTTLLREIIKDTEDMKGDEEYECETIPIKLGITNTKIVLFLICGVIMGGLGYWQYKQWESNDDISFFYFLLLLQAPFILMIYKIQKASKKSDYTLISKLNKGIMLAGLLYTIVIYTQTLKTPEQTTQPEEITPQVNISGGY
jgi:4-hydroxybenzoate polyprenyltransferase